MLYKGVELPALPDLPQNVDDYKAMIFVYGPNREYALLYIGCIEYAPITSLPYRFQLGPSAYLYMCNYPSDVWTLNDTYTSVSFLNLSKRFQDSSCLIWTNYDLVLSDGTTYLATTPIDPNASVATMTHYTTNFGADYSHTTFEVDGLSDSDTYFIRGYCYQDSSLIATVDSPSWTGSGTYCTVEFSGLIPSTTYDFEYVLYVNDTETSVTYTNSVTTLEASSGGDDSGGGGTGDSGGSSGGCTECPSILSSILSAITNQSTFLSDWKQDWTSRMDSLEDAVVSAISALAPAPDPTETALKTATAETTKAVADEVFADDSPTKVTASDVKDVAEIGAAASSMFDSGVSVGSFFDAFNNVTLVSFFTQAVHDDLHSVSVPVTISDDDSNSVVDYYNENLSKIKKFVGGE